MQHISFDSACQISGDPEAITEKLINADWAFGKNEGLLDSSKNMVSYPRNVGHGKQRCCEGESLDNFVYSVHLSTPWEICNNIL